MRTTTIGNTKFSVSFYLKRQKATQDGWEKIIAILLILGGVFFLLFGNWYKNNKQQHRIESGQPQ